MPSALDRIDFGPPPSSGRLRALTLAVCVHALLIAALTWGVSWKRSDTEPSFSAELWSTAVQQAAPPMAQLPTPPTPPTTPIKPTPPTAVLPPLPPPPQAELPKPLVAPTVDIALEQEKKRKLKLQKQQREQEDAQDKRQAAMDTKAEKDAQAKRDKQNEAKRQADDAKKKELVALEAKNKAAPLSRSR